MIGIVAVSGLLSGCDPQRIRELQEGRSTESDLRARFGESESVRDAPQGGRTPDYNRQPQGYQRQTHCDWRYRDAPNANDARIFTVVMDAYLRVVWTGSATDLNLDQGDRR